MIRTSADDRDGEFVEMPAGQPLNKTLHAAGARMP
jgi:hypothetical protein